MLLRLSDAKQPIACWEPKNKTYKKSETADFFENEKQDKILSQVNASQNSQQTIGSTHNCFQPLAM